MPYGSSTSYQSGYQSGGGPGIKSRKSRDYEDIDDFPSNHHNGSNGNGRHQMQMMEISTGMDYGNDSSRDDVVGVGRRWTLYACVAILLIIAVLVPHRESINEDVGEVEKSRAPNATTTLSGKGPLPKTNAADVGSTYSTSTSSAEDDDYSSPDDDHLITRSPLTTMPLEKIATKSPIITASLTPSNNTRTGSNSSSSWNNHYNNNQSTTISSTTTTSSPTTSPTIPSLPSCQHWDQHEQVTLTRDAHNFTKLNDTTNLCWDSEISPTDCHCLNSVVPARPSYTPEQWDATMRMNMRLVNQSAGVPLDVVFVGDSITEHWNGRDMGRYRDKDQNVSMVFDQLFQTQQQDNQSQRKEETVQGLALGVAGDRCQNLLYRLQNGEMPDHLNPKVWWLLIGVNDVRSDACSADSIVAGNIRVVEEIRQRRPNTPIIINSVLPFGETELLFHSPQWAVLSQVNHRLECYAQRQPLVEFFNATDIFIYTDTTDGGNYVNPLLMPDHLHPSGKGALLWGRQIVAKVLNLTSAQDEAP